MQANGYPVGWQLQMRTEKGVRWVKMYGAKLVENVIQFIARIHNTQAWLECARAGMRVVSQEHDKLFAIVRESEAEAALAFMQAAMRRAPDWMPNVPLDSEGYISKAMKK
jgi:DNA polymerase bacteriophage-type